MGVNRHGGSGLLQWGGVFYRQPCLELLGHGDNKQIIKSRLIFLLLLFKIVYTPILPHWYATICYVTIVAFKYIIKIIN